MTEAEKQRHEDLDDICSRFTQIAGCCDVLRERLIGDGAASDMLGGMKRIADDGCKALTAILDGPMPGETRQQWGDRVLEEHRRGAK